ncbi:Nitrobenzene nitroreductase [Pseudocercospora fuligena]|uniref:Nitrobenzene nitroreductase n=1 Tax=Pseudocercospora fuligena TaxID=685502 RepID=A0A8H6VGF7_9PEZI|nr:Nitrobenzene nitroreductase [Pseudocercospora fuligena]
MASDQNPPASEPHSYLETCIRQRHSIRYYKSDPVPESDLYHCLSLAQLSPSNSNIQNWRISIASGKARDRIISALESESKVHGPEGIPALPEDYRHFRSEFGHLLYGKEGYDIPRHHKDEHKAAQMRNYSFFDAPTVACITMNKDLSGVDAMSVGLFIQTFMLALTERGLGSCLQVSVTGYPELLRKEFGLKDDQMVLCGMAIGYPAEGQKVNDLHVPREELEHCVSMLKV